MKTTSKASPNVTQSAERKDSCRTGGCGGPGLCPGVALLLAYLLGSGAALITGFTWLGWGVGVAVAIVLVTGAWRFLPWSGT